MEPTAADTRHRKPASCACSVAQTLLMLCAWSLANRAAGGGPGIRALADAVRRMGQACRVERTRLEGVDRLARVLLQVQRRLRPRGGR